MCQRTHSCLLLKGSLYYHVVSVRRASFELVFMYCMIFIGDANFNSPKRNKSRKRQIDGKKEATAVVQKIREKSKIEKEINRIDVNVQKLLNLSQTNQINKKSENKVIVFSAATIRV